MNGVADELADRLADRFGEQLRSVGYYDDDGRELAFVREDVEAEYDRGDVDRVFRTVRLEAIDRPNQEELYSHGDLLCTVRCFEEATEFHVVKSETEGAVAAVDAGAIDDLRETAEVCVSTLDA